MDEVPERPLRVAVVDDDVGIRTVLRMLLSVSEGVTLTAEAADADEAVTAIGPDVDAVLLDHDLREGCGLALIPHFREVCPGAMIAVFSSLPAESAAANAFLAGAFAYYEKSLLGSALVDRLQEDVARRRRSATARPLTRPDAQPDDPVAPIPGMP